MNIYYRLFKPTKRKSYSVHKMADVVLRGLYDADKKKKHKMVDVILDEKRIFFNQDLLNKTVTILRNRQLIDVTRNNSNSVGIYDNNIGSHLFTEVAKHSDYTIKEYVITKEGKRFAETHQSLDEEGKRKREENIQRWIDRVLGFLSGGIVSAILTYYLTKK